MVFHGHAGFIVVKKLQGLKAKIKAWNKDTWKVRHIKIFIEKGDRGVGQVRKREILKSSRVRFKVRALKQVMGDKSMQRNILETEVENVVAQRGGQEHEILSHVANARRRRNFISKIKSRGRLIKSRQRSKRKWQSFLKIFIQVLV